MNTVRSEKIRWERLMSRQISCGAHKLSARWSISAFRRRKCPPLIHALALTKRSGKS